MIVKQNYLINKQFLPFDVCDDIIKVADQQQQEEATTQDGLNEKVRNSRITWLADRWIYDWIDSYIVQVNKEVGWNFDFIGAEQIQFTRYLEGQFYGWHQDSNFKEQHERKISVVIPLSDSEDYEGGDLQFYDSLQRPEAKDSRIMKDENTRTRGSIIIFPSYIFHRVTKVTKGQRLSIVLWYKGEKWK